MFLKINAKNTHNEIVERVINVEDITLVGEEHQDDETFYDEFGNVVKTVAPVEKLYFVLFKSCGPVKVKQDAYDAICKALGL